MVPFVCSANFRDMVGQNTAPMIPATVAVIERQATSTMPIFNSVRANRIAVPEIVATASESRNQAIKKITTCLSFHATLTVFQRDSHANAPYAKNDPILPRSDIIWRGGPGRVRSHIEAGIVNTNHQSPTRNNTTRSGRVDDTEVFDMKKRIIMLRICMKTAAAYPMPTPVEDIFEESLRSDESSFGPGGFGVVGLSSSVDKLASGDK